MSDAQGIKLARTGSTRAPNILMLFSDEHNPAYAGFMGSKIVRTPNLDRLAREGAVFDNAYCNSPLCSPSRQSFMSGLYCHEIGCWNNTAAMPEDTLTWAHALSAGGYETSLVGKMHFNGYQKMYGFDRRPVLEANVAGEQFYSYGIRTSHSWTDPLPYTSGPDGRGMWTELMEAGPDKPERQPIFAHDLRILDGTLELLREKARNPQGQPWAVCASFVLPHPPWKARADLLPGYLGKGDLPANRLGTGRDTCDRYMQHYYGHLKDLPEAQVRYCREVYFALITEFDEYAGRILDELEKLGLAEDTIVFYFSDHGEMAGEHGLWGKTTLLESSIRVPLIVRAPGRVKAGMRVTTPVSLVDLYPTFLDFAGVLLPAPLRVSGHSLVPLMTGREKDFGGQYVFGEFEGEGWNHPRAFLREGRFKYVHNHTAEERLYDLEADPLELTDLSAQPVHAALKTRLRERMLSFWNPAEIEDAVLAAQVRRKIARNRNVCKDVGW